MKPLLIVLALLITGAAPPDDADIGVLAFVKGGAMLVGGGVRLDEVQRVGVLVLEDVKTGRPIRQFVGHTDEVVAVAVSPDETLLASSGWERSVRVWDLRGARPARVLQGDDEFVSALAFAPDGRTLVTGGSAGVVRIRNVESGRIVRSLAGDTEWINSIVFTHGGARLMAAGDEGIIRAWESATGRLVLTIRGGQKSINSLALSPDGRTLASSGDDGTVRLWDADSGASLKVLRPPPDPESQFGPEDRAGPVAFSADGAVLAAVLYSNDVRLWDVKEGRPIRLLPIEEDVLSVAFSPDGKVLATGTIRGIQYWEWPWMRLIKKGEKGLRAK